MGSRAERSRRTEAERRARSPAGPRRPPGRGGAARDLEALAREIVACRRCPRLIRHCRQVARTRRRQYRTCVYWGRPVPGFGDPEARLILIGLAPAAHGANRTGRMFTGDRSGEWLYRALCAFGFANQPTSVGREDGLALRDAYVTAAVRCAPPGNKPARDEIAACGAFLDREIALLPRARVVVALGGVAFDAYLAARARGHLPVPRPRPRFGHGRLVRLGDVALLASYHPSQQNTFTGRLTQGAFDRIFRQARALLAWDLPPGGG